MAFIAGVRPRKETDNGGGAQPPLNPLIANPNGPTATNVRNEIAAGAQGATAAANRFAPGQFSSSPFAQGLFQKFNNRQGFSPEAFRGHRNQVDRTASTALQQRISDLRNRASAAGNTAGLPLAEAMLSAQSGADVQGSLDNFLIESERTGAQQQQGAAQVLAQLLGLEQRQNEGFANVQLNRTFAGAPGIDPATGQPIGPGGGPAGGQQYQFLNEQGQMSRAPKTPQEWQQFYAERLAYERGTGRTMPVFGF